jgi:hypothetical protein
MVEDYIDSKIRRDLAKQIRDLELPPDWRTKDVINYILRIVEHGEAPRENSKSA